MRCMLRLLKRGSLSCARANARLVMLDCGCLADTALALRERPVYGRILRASPSDFDPVLLRSFWQAARVRVKLTTPWPCRSAPATSQRAHPARQPRFLRLLVPAKGASSLRPHTHAWQRRCMGTAHQSRQFAHKPHARQLTGLHSLAAPCLLLLHDHGTVPPHVVLLRPSLAVQVWIHSAPLAEGGTEARGGRSGGTIWRWRCIAGKGASVWGAMQDSRFAPGAICGPAASSGASRETHLQDSEEARGLAARAAARLQQLDARGGGVVAHLSITKASVLREAKAGALHDRVRARGRPRAAGSGSSCAAAQASPRGPLLPPRHGPPRHGVCTPKRSTVTAQPTSQPSTLHSSPRTRRRARPSPPQLQTWPPAACGRASARVRGAEGAAEPEAHPWWVCF
jgi:hypothetical protein